MGLPSKQRTSRSRDDRRAHHALVKVGIAVCSSCKAPILPHRACAQCGEYKGKKAVDVAKRIQRHTRNKKTASAK